MERRSKFLGWTAGVAALVVPLLFVFQPVPVAAFYAFLSVAAISLAVSNLVFEHDKVSDRITLAGTLLGIIGCTLVPGLMGQSSWWMGGLTSIVSATITSGVLTAFIELYKRLAGQRPVRFEEPTDFVWEKDEDGSALLEISGELLPWTTLLIRETDELRVECQEAWIDSAPLGSVELVFRQDRVIVGGRRYPLAEISEVHGLATHLSVPREAMGFGIVRLMTAFAACFGWQGTLFTFFGGAMLGGFGAARFIRYSPTTSRVPFVPFLSAAAVIWMVCGPSLVSLYLKWLHANDHVA